MSETNSPTPSFVAAPREADAPMMSTPETLSNIFFEPGRTFEALRERPRFLVAALVALVMFMLFYLAYIQRVGYDNIVNAEIETRARGSEMSDEQKAAARNIQSKPFVKAIRYASPLLGIAIMFAAGAGIYLLGAMLMGKGMSYKQALSVWTYSSLPPLVLVMVANLLILFVRPPTEEAEIARGLSGLVHANPGIVVDAAAHPVLATALGSLDLFAFYGLFLAALGLRKVARLSTGSAWAVVLGLWLLGVIARTVGSSALGTPM
ncbi:MAG TPA: YIP1 family protein [Pyrinomonadaceae bacterium]|nr:YIP1 family protein [Pyrinomonadaceae bacterium]